MSFKLKQQAKLLFLGIPLAGTTIDALTSRFESNWAALGIWSSKGNAQAVQKAGSGRLALCAWIAAKALADDARIEAFQRSSGISPSDFATYGKLFTEAIHNNRASTSNPTTPRRNAIYRNFEPSSSSSLPSPKSQDQTPEAREKRMRDVMSGAAFASNSSPIGRSSRIDTTSAPQTPTSRTLRDRSSIKEVQIFDPSKYDTITPTKKSVVFEASSTNQSSKRPFEVNDEAPVSPSKHIKAPVKKRHRLIVGYPGGEPLRKGRRLEYTGEWDNTHARERVKQYSLALDQCQDKTGWEKGQAVCQIQLDVLI